MMCTSHAAYNRGGRREEEILVRPANGNGDVHVHRHRGLEPAAAGAGRRLPIRPGAARRDHPAGAGDRGGREVRTEGDAFFIAFSSPIQGFRTAVSSQRALAEAAWPHGRPLRVRMGLHTGEGALLGGDYIGIDVNRAARIAAAGHGGQILVSDATRALVEDGLPEGVSLRSLGRHVLRTSTSRVRSTTSSSSAFPTISPPIRTLGGRGRANLPSPLTSFVGREQEVAEVTDLLTRERSSSWSVPAARGRHRRSLRIAAEMADQVGDGVLSWTSAPSRTRPRVPSTISKSLGVHEDHHRDPIDTLLEAASDLDDLLSWTTSSRCSMRGSWSPSFSTARRVSGSWLRAARPCIWPASTGTSSGHSLFPDSDTANSPSSRPVNPWCCSQTRAGTVARDFRLTDANAADVAEIVRRLDGLPLAIELAASRINVLDPRVLRERLDSRLGLLVGGPRDSPERQRTLRGTIEWSYDLLEPDERTLFARLACFRGGWTLASAEAVCAPGLGIGVLDGLGSLVDRSLIRREPTAEAGRAVSDARNDPRVRERATGDIRRSSGILRRHAEYIRDLAEEAEPHLRSEHQTRWLTRLERELDNVRAALTGRVRS